jgi:hypothetical protein
MPVILAIQEAEIRKQSRVKVSLRQNIHEAPSQSTARQSGVYLSFQLCRRLRLGGMWFQDNVGKKFVRPNLNRKSWAW